MAEDTTPIDASAIREELTAKLSDQANSTSELPSLITEKTILDEWNDKLDALLSSLFDRGTKPLDKVAWEPVFVGIKYVAAALVVALVIYLLYMTWKYFRSRFASGWMTADALQMPISLHPEEGLLAALAAAKQQNQWAKAMRLRWLLFLRRGAQPSHRTPREYFQLYREQGALKPTPQYDLMFGGHAAQDFTYANYDSALAKLEDKAGPS